MWRKNKKKFHHEGSKIEKRLKLIDYLEEIIEDEYKESVPAFKSVKVANEHVSGTNTKGLLLRSCV